VVRLGRGERNQPPSTAIPELPWDSGLCNDWISWDFIYKVQPRHYVSRNLLHPLYFFFDIYSWITETVSNREQTIKGRTALL